MKDSVPQPVLEPMVKRILLSLHPQTRKLYTSICKKPYIAEAQANQEGWIVGRFESTKVGMYGGAGISATAFYRTCWPQLRSAGLVIEDKDEKGFFLIPFFRKKTESLKPMQDKAHALRMLKRMNEVERRIINLEKHMEQVGTKSPLKLWQFWKRQPRPEGR